MAIRRPIANEETHDYLRITLFVAPFTVLIPPNNQYNLSILNIPQDDTHTFYYFIAWSDKELGGEGYVTWYPFEHPQLGAVELGDPHLDAAGRNADGSKPRGQFLAVEAGKRRFYCRCWRRPGAGRAVRQIE